MARNVPAIKTEILLGVNSVLQGTRQAYNAFKTFNEAIRESNRQLNALQRSSSQTQVQIKGLSSTLLGMAGTLRSLDKVNSMFNSVLGGAYNYSKTLETNAVGISGILTSMVKVNGKQLQWNESMQMSVSIMNELRKQALQTSATAPELIDTFRALLGPGLGSGMKIDEIMKLTKVGVTAVKSIGLDGTQLVQELRSMIQGSIRPASSTLATALGITNVDVKNAKNSAEGLYQFLIKRLTGFEQSVRATAGTVQGRLDILKEGFYQGIELAGRGLWRDFKDEITAISEKFLVFDKNTKEITLNPKFVQDAKDVADTIKGIKDSFSWLIDGLTKNTSGILKAISFGVILKVSASALNSFLGFVVKGANSIGAFKNAISNSNIELQKQIKLEQAIDGFSGKLNNKTIAIKEMNGLVKSLSGEIYNLSKHFKQLGANAEQAQRWQNEIVKAINNGKSVEQVKELISNYENLTNTYKSAKERIREIDDGMKLASEQSLNTEKERLAILQRTEQLRKQATSGLVGAIGVGSKNVRKDLSDVYKYSSSKNEYGLGAFEKRIMASTFDEYDKADHLLSVKQRIWAGDYNSANDLIKMIDNSIVGYKQAQQEEDRRLAIEKEVAKAQREQYQWLNKQIEANIRLANSKPKYTEQQQQFNLFKRSVTDSIADAKAQKDSAKLSKDQQYIQSFINGKTKSKAYNDENVAMVKSLMEKVQEAGFSKQQADEYAKSFVNKLQSGKVSAEKTKQFYDESIKQLEQVKQKYAEIKTESDAVFNKAINAGLMKEQAQKLKEAYVSEMTNGSRESAKAWREAFNKNIRAVQEKINGVMRGVGANNSSPYTVADTSTKTKAQALKELEFNYQRTIEAYSKVNQEGAAKIKSAFETIKKAQSEELLTAEQASKLEIEYRLKVANGYYDEAIAIQKVIEEQYKAGTLASETAQKERQVASEKAKTSAIERQSAIAKEWILNLDGQILNVQQRNAIITSSNLALQGKGYTNIEKAIKDLLDMESKINQKVRETGEIAPPVYKKILELIKQLTEAEKDLEKTEQEEIENVKKLGQAYLGFNGKLANTVKLISGLGGALTSAGFLIQACSDDTESVTGKFAEWAIKIGFVSSSLTGLIDNLKELWKLPAFSVLAKAGAIGAIVGGLSAGVYAYVNDLSMDEIKRRYFNSKVDYWNEGEDFEYTDWTEQNKANLKDVEVANPPSGDDDSKGAKKQERINKRINDAIASYKILQDTVNITSGKLTGSYTKYQEAIDGANKKTDQWQKSLKDLVVNSGGALDENGEIVRYGKITKEMYDDLCNSFVNYEKLVKDRAGEDLDIQRYENELQRIQNLENVKVLTTKQANERRQQTLNDEIIYYENLLEKHNWAEDEKLKYETIIAEKRKALRDTEETDEKLHWDNILEHMKNTYFNQTETVKSAYDGMVNTFVNFGQNMMTESKSLSERFKDLFNDFTNSIVNMLMKIIMQALIMRAVTGLFNKSGSSIRMSSNSANISGGLINACQFASGGLAEGWSIVGEKGPELVNFSSPGRVYTAEQTKKALGGSGTDVNIKIDLKNESGQQLQAETTGSNFDGENYVVGVVLKAISTNKYGMRTTLKGLANT